MSAEPLLLGRVAGVFGVKGWVKLFSYTDPRDAILGYREFLLRRDGQWKATRWAESKPHGKNVLARLDGIDDRDAALALVGADIGLDREQLPEADAGSFYWADLQGMTVVHKDGRPLGKVAYLLATGAHDVLVVQGEKDEVLVPFVPERYVLDVDLKSGVIQVDWEWD